MILSLQPVTESLPLLDLQIIHQIQYHIYPKYVDRQAWEDISNPYGTPQNAAPDKAVHCFWRLHISP